VGGSQAHCRRHGRDAEAAHLISREEP
jgi:hypothetical protein